jgi:hypothetical protein
MMGVTMQDNFYVYILYRADGVTPFYVGKGKGSRIKQHEKDLEGCNPYKSRIIAEMLRDGIKVPAKKVVSSLAETKAFWLERFLITFIGRHDLGLGPLTNLTNGGDGVAGLIRTDEYKKEKSEVLKKLWEDPMYREKQLVHRSSEEFKSFTSEHFQKLWKDPAYRENIVDSVKSQWDDGGSLRVIDRSKPAKELWSDPDRRTEMLKKRESTRLSNLETRSPEERAEKARSISEKRKAIWRDPEYRARMKLRRKRGEIK